MEENIILIKKKRERLIKKIEKNMPIENIIDYLEQNEENLNIFNKDKKGNI